MSKFKFVKLLENDNLKLLKGKGESGDKMQAHMADRDAFLLILKGSLDFRLGAKTHSLGGDDFLEIPAQEVHSFTVDKACEVLLVLDPKTKMTFVP
ncbi:MAG: cupin domain-containing protein [Saprospiraceae bacterium]|nr:cupin domain-containing protein [Saprospiraceae bacterium]